MLIIWKSAPSVANDTGDCLVVHNNTVVFAMNSDDDGVVDDDSCRWGDEVVSGKRRDSRSPPLTQGIDCGDYCLGAPGAVHRAVDPFSSVVNRVAVGGGSCSPMCLQAQAAATGCCATSDFEGTQKELDAGLHTERLLLKTVPTRDNFVYDEKGAHGSNDCAPSVVDVDSGSCDICLGAPGAEHQEVCPCSSVASTSSGDCAPCADSVVSRGGICQGAPGAVRRDVGPRSSVAMSSDCSPSDVGDDSRRCMTTSVGLIDIAGIRRLAADFDANFFLRHRRGEITHIKSRWRCGFFEA